MQLKKNLYHSSGFTFIMIGLVLLADGGYFYSSQTNFLVDAKPTEGQVVDLVRKQFRVHVSFGLGSARSAVVRFADDNNDSHQFTDIVSYSPPRYSKGQKVQILYAPDDPENAIIDDFWGRWALTSIIGGLGVVFVLLGCGMHFWRTRKRR